MTPPTSSPNSLSTENFSESGSSPESSPPLLVSPYGRFVIGVDLLLCLVNIFALGWMVYKLHVQQDANYFEYSMFVNTGIIVTAIVGFFGLAGNLMMLGGRRAGIRFAWYRITLGLATVVWLLSMMFLVLPGSSLLSEANQSTYLMFLPPSLLYGLWMIVYTTSFLMVVRRVRR